FHRAYHLCGAGGVPADLPASRTGPTANGRRRGAMRIAFRLFIFASAATFLSALASAQTVQTLTLQQAEQLAIQNHPHIQAATAFALAAEAQVREARAAYYPNANGSLTGAEAVDSNRIGAGVLNAPRVFDKYANGFSVN